MRRPSRRHPACGSTRSLRGPGAPAGARSPRDAADGAGFTSAGCRSGRIMHTLDRIGVHSAGCIALPPLAISGYNRRARCAIGTGSATMQQRVSDHRRGQRLGRALAFCFARPAGAWPVPTSTSNATHGEPAHGVRRRPRWRLGDVADDASVEEMRGRGARGWDGSIVIKQTRVGRPERSGDTSLGTGSGR